MLGPGDVIAGRYCVEHQLGEGGMGAVYRATQLPLKRDVALKVILPQKTTEVARERFLREARVASALKHPNVVAIYDYGEHEGMLFLAMELLNGASLRSIVDFGLPPLPLDQAVEIAAQVADVLDAARAIPLVHRDLKPENVMLDRTPDGRERCVVVDFGLAFVGGEADEETGRLTREGAVTGTPDYMPPEQCRGSHDLDGAADIYSLGAMLYEMLTAHPPFEGTAALVISRHLFVKPKRVRDAFPDIEIPGALEDLIAAMLAKDPNDRPSAAHVRKALDGVRPGGVERMSGTSTGRAARMVSIQAPPMTSSTATTQQRVAWWGDISVDVETGLAANGIEAVDAREGIPSDVDAVFVPSAAHVRKALDGVRPGGVERMSGTSTGRAARMVSIQAPPMTSSTATTQQRVAWWGDISVDVETGLAANGIEAVDAREGIPSDVDAVFVPSASLEDIELLLPTGIPVVAGSAAGDVERLTALLRLGVAEVCPLDASTAELARKLNRVIRRNKRKK